MSKFDGLIGSIAVVGERNGFVDALVFVVVTDVGDIFKNGFFDWTDVGSVLLFVLNSAFETFNESTLIFCIVPRLSKCVTVTVSVVAGLAGVVPFRPSDDGCLSMIVASIVDDAFGNADNDDGLFFVRPADDGGVMDGKSFENGDVGVTVPLFFRAFDDPVKFSVSLSPPFLLNIMF